MNCNHEKNGNLAFLWGLNYLIPADFVFDHVHTHSGNMNETEYVFLRWGTIWVTFNLTWIFYSLSLSLPMLFISEWIVLTPASYSGCQFQITAQRWTVVPIVVSYFPQFLHSVYHLHFIPFSMLYGLILIILLTKPSHHTQGSRVMIAVPMVTADSILWLTSKRCTKLKHSQADLYRHTVAHCLRCHLQHFKFCCLSMLQPMCILNIEPDEKTRQMKIECYVSLAHLSLINLNCSQLERRLLWCHISVVKFWFRKPETCLATCQTRLERMYTIFFKPLLLW
jgi:hypothetical protein